MTQQLYNMFNSSAWDKQLIIILTFLTECRILLLGACTLSHTVQILSQVRLIVHLCCEVYRYLCWNTCILWFDISHANKFLEIYQILSMHYPCILWFDISHANKFLEIYQILSNTPIPCSPLLSSTTQQSVPSKTYQKITIYRTCTTCTRPTLSQLKMVSNRTDNIINSD